MISGGFCRCLIPAIHWRFKGGLGHSGVWVAEEGEKCAGVT